MASGSKYFLEVFRTCDPAVLTQIEIPKPIKTSSKEGAISDEMVNRILKYTSGSRNTWLFSATMPDEIQRIIKTYIDADAPKIAVNKNSIVVFCE